MKVFLSAGSNIRPRRKALSLAVTELARIGSIQKISPVYETPALLPEDAPAEGPLSANSSETGPPDESPPEAGFRRAGPPAEGPLSSWNRPFLNLCLQMEFEGEAPELLGRLQAIEKKAGRKKREKHAPRELDLDILLFGDQKISLPHLKIPHPEMEKRAFVLDPLKDILPDYIQKARRHKDHAPLWAAVLNVTPDSFSDGGRFADEEDFLKTALKLEKAGAAVLDTGAESTRPGAQPLSPEEEIARLKPCLGALSRHYKERILKPLISVDTRFAKTAEAALKQGADIINDVSGLQDPDMLSVLKNSSASYILTHSLDVPVNPRNILKGDPLKALCLWLKQKLEILEKNHIENGRVFFDPGIGFGKSSLQSLKILRNLKAFHSFPVRLFVGHSRKSFMGDFCSYEAPLRDWETVGVSMELTRRGADALRVHNVEAHVRAFRGFSHARAAPAFQKNKDFQITPV